MESVAPCIDVEGRQTYKIYTMDESVGDRRTYYYSLMQSQREVHSVVPSREIGAAVAPPSQILQPNRAGRSSSQAQSAPGDQPTRKAPEPREAGRGRGPEVKASARSPCFGFFPQRRGGPTQQGRPNTSSVPSIPPGSSQDLTYADLPPVVLRHSPHAAPAILSILRQAEQTIVGTQYNFDYEEGISVLESKRRQNVQIRILLDKGQFLRKKSSKDQAEKVRSLQEWGVEFKMYQPPGSLYGCLHAKTWVCDGQIYVGGSANFTRNSLTNSQENVVIIKLDPESDTVIAPYLVWFEELWAIAEGLGEEQ